MTQQTHQSVIDLPGEQWRDIPNTYHPISYQSTIQKYARRRIKEEWRAIASTDGRYEVSNLGHVRLKGKSTIRVPQDNGHGYKYIGIKQNGKIVNIYVHRAVAEAFIPNPHNYTQVSHQDETRSNNVAWNLKWASAKENCNMPLHLLRASTSRGTPIRCVETGIIYRSAREAARQLGFGQTNISRVVREGKGTAYGYHWEFANSNMREEV